MRIALSHTRGTDVGGVERYIHALAVRLIAAGHDVHYFCHWWDETVDERIVFHRLPNWAKQIRFLRVLLFDRHTRAAIAREGPFDVVHGFSKTSAQDIYRDGSGSAIDYQAFLDSVGSSWLSRLLGKLSLAHWITRRIEAARYTPGNFKRIVAISELVKAQILSHYPLVPDDIRVIYSGVDLERFHPRTAADARPLVRAELELPEGAPLLLFVGSDYRRKGLCHFLEALAALPRAHAAVIGRETRKQVAAHRALAKRLGVDSRVRFLGVRKHVERYFAASDCFVFPTLFDAFGNVVLESMAAGVPAVVSAKAGGAEVVRPGETGAVVADPSDVPALVEAVRPYLDRGLCADHGAAAREEATAYSWDRHFQDIVGLYEEVAGA